MVKTITIRDEVYEKLASAKNREESFSEFLDRLVEDANGIETLKRLRGTLTLPKKKILQEIAEKRSERRR